MFPGYCYKIANAITLFLIGTSLSVASGETRAEPGRLKPQTTFSGATLEASSEGARRIVTGTRQLFEKTRCTSSRGRSYPCSQFLYRFKVWALNDHSPSAIFNSPGFLYQLPEGAETDYSNYYLRDMDESGKVVALSQGADVYLYEPDQGRYARSMLARAGSADKVQHAEFTPDGSKLVTANSNTVYLWPLRPLGQNEWARLNASHTITAKRDDNTLEPFVALAVTDEWLVIAFSDTLSLVRLSGSNPGQKSSENQTGLSAVSICRGATPIVAASAGSEVMLWKINNETLEYWQTSGELLNSPVTRIYFPPPCGLLAFQTGNNHSEIWKADEDGLQLQYQISDSKGTWIEHQQDQWQRSWLFTISQTGAVISSLGPYEPLQKRAEIQTNGTLESLHPYLASGQLITGDTEAVNVWDISSLQTVCDRQPDDTAIDRVPVMRPGCLQELFFMHSMPLTNNIPAIIEEITPGSRTTYANADASFSRADNDGPTLTVVFSDIVENFKVKGDLHFFMPWNGTEANAGQIPYAYASANLETYSDQAPDTPAETNSYQGILSINNGVVEISAQKRSAEGYYLLVSLYPGRTEVDTSEKDVEAYGCDTLQHFLADNFPHAEYQTSYNNTLPKTLMDNISCLSYQHPGNATGHVLFVNLSPENASLFAVTRYQPGLTQLIWHGTITADQQQSPDYLVITQNPE